MERENLHGDAKGKAQVATTARPKVPMHRIGTNCFVVVMKRGSARGAKGAGQKVQAQREVDAFGKRAIISNADRQ